MMKAIQEQQISTDGHFYPNKMLVSQSTEKQQATEGDWP